MHLKCIFVLLVFNILWWRSTEYEPCSCSRLEQGSINLKSNKAQLPPLALRQTNRSRVVSLTGESRFLCTDMDFQMLLEWTWWFKTPKTKNIQWLNKENLESGVTAERWKKKKKVERQNSNAEEVLLRHLRHCYCYFCTMWTKILCPELSCGQDERKRTTIWPSLNRRDSELLNFTWFMDAPGEKKNTLAPYGTWREELSLF